MKKFKGVFHKSFFRRLTSVVIGCLSATGLLQAAPVTVTGTVTSG